MTTVQTPTRHEEVRRELERQFGARALVDPVSRGLYATDASVWQFEPIGIVVPESEEDIAAVLRLAREFGVPVLPRGGGTSLAGQTCNEAVVLDVSKHLNRILEVNEAERWVRVQAGIVRDELNAALRPTGLEFAPETSTSNRANIGGMIGNNSSGTRSIRYGRTLEHVLECRVMLANGEIVECKPRSRAEIDALMAGDSEEGKLWRAMTKIVEENRALIEERFPKVLRRVGGYSLDVFPRDGDWNLAKFLCGSEGTLAVVLDAKLALVEAPRHVRMLAIHFADLIEGLATVPAILRHDPLSVEVLDGAMIELSRNNPSTRPHCFFIEGVPGLILTVEMEGDSPEGALARIERLRAECVAQGRGYAWAILDTPEKCFEVLELRRKGLGVSLSVPGDTKPVSWIEDACVPVEHLADYTRQVLEVATSFGLKTVIYGHASVGVLHIKPALNLKDPEHLKAMAEISRRAMQLCKSYGGSWSGEHGDGVARGAQNEEFWGPQMYEVFHQVKRAWDPKNILNPNRIIDAPAVNENLRYGADYRVTLPPTFFRFKDFGGFAPAVEMCNGVGACRKTLGGTMCPSYMATRDEEATTRGRANALRLAMSGRFGKEGIVHERVHEVLDLCLECKACKTECPSNVDMARMKSEHLAHYHAEHGTTLRERSFADAPVTGRRFSGLLAPVVNGVMGIAPLRRAMLGFLGIAQDRSLPAFAPKTLESWFDGRRERNTDGRDVVLFGDCWANYHETAPGRYAVRVLEKLGFRVTLVANACCQRTRISKGFLDEARREGTRTVDLLRPLAARGFPILAIEPSCASSLTDDLPDLVDNVDAARTVASMVRPIEEFLAVEIATGRLPAPAPKGPAPRYLVHGHCHQKALFTTEAARRLLALEGNGVAPQVAEVDSGCCGMAGSFGYEAEHYDISRKIAESRLLPAIRQEGPDTILVANGFSCRHQVADFAGRKSMHVIEAFGRALFDEWDKK
jgi:FAD/FMN-containing dehydrogenase/Fe-S oxidoreductase